MRLCILTQPRTSSTNLSFLLGRLSGYEVYNEPFHGYHGIKKYRTEPFTKDDNIILKEMPFFHQPFGVEGSEQFFEWSQQNFDKVIYLLRRDTQKQSESFCYRLILSHEDPNTKWHDQKEYDMSIVPLKKIQYEKERMDQRNEIFIKNSSIHSNPLFYYEDLIINEGNNENMIKLINYIGLSFDKNIVRTYYGINKKCRVDSKKTNTLI